jgi:methylated-DNA-[protein]-cysteine S-methyltransferase
MCEKNNTPIIISTHNDKNLHYAVGFNKNGKIVRISLPQKSANKAISEISNHHPKFRLSNKHNETARKICKIYHGKDEDKNLELLELDFYESTIQTTFERDVILEVSKIPYGKVKTYKEIAKSLNSTAYRAVGTAIGKNPFPILVPCHRVIRSDGKVGDFRGGSSMKIEILENEGIKIDKSKVVD